MQHRISTSGARALRAGLVALALSVAACSPRGPGIPAAAIPVPDLPPALVPPPPAAAPVRAAPAPRLPSAVYPPRFEAFPPAEGFVGRPARVDLRSRPWARRFRTMLRTGAAGGPNFAGAYTIVWWGCGTQCQQWAVVDARNGKVYGNPFDAELGLAFRADSRLVVVNPLEPGETPGPGRPAPAYFVWNGREMLRIPPPPPSS